MSCFAVSFFAYIAGLTGTGTVGLSLCYCTLHAVWSIYLLQQFPGIPRDQQLQHMCVHVKHKLLCHFPCGSVLGKFVGLCKGCELDFDVCTMREEDQA